MKRSMKEIEKEFQYSEFCELCELEKYCPEELKHIQTNFIVENLEIVEQAVYLHIPTNKKYLIEKLRNEGICILGEVALKLKEAYCLKEKI